jgi:hypothetical protein
MTSKEKITLRVKQVPDLRPAWTQSEANNFNTQEHLRRLEQRLLEVGIPGLRGAEKLIRTYIDGRDKAWNRDIVSTERRSSPWVTGRRATQAEQARAVAISEGISSLYDEPLEDQVWPLSAGDMDTINMVLSFNPGLEVVGKPSYDPSTSLWTVKLRTRRYSTMISNF